MMLKGRGDLHTAVRRHNHSPSFQTFAYKGRPGPFPLCIYPDPMLRQVPVNQLEDPFPNTHASKGNGPFTLDVVQGIDDPLHLIMPTAED